MAAQQADVDHEKLNEKNEDKNGPDGTEIHSKSDENLDDNTDLLDMQRLQECLA